jgi:hypothetical protein
MLFLPGVAGSISTIAANAGIILKNHKIDFRQKYRYFDLFEMFLFFNTNHTHWKLDDLQKLKT